MLKKFLLIIAILLLIIVGSGYLIYANRKIIINKVVDYTVQSITGNTQNADTEDSWINTLLGTDSADMKTMVLQTVMKGMASKQNSKTQGQVVRRKQGLATMADMLVNAASDNNNANLGQMAQGLLNSLSGSSAAEFVNSVEHDINARDSKGRTLLMNVCRVDVTPKVVKMLLQYGADVNAVDENGRTALMFAAGLNRNLAVVEMLIENGAQIKSVDSNDKTAYDYAKDPLIKELLQ